MMNEGLGLHWSPELGRSLRPLSPGSFFGEKMLPFAKNIDSAVAVGPHRQLRYGHILQVRT